MNSAACPPADDLSGFALGHLPAARFTQLGEHVERCVACAATLEKLDGLADPLLVQLRGAAQMGLALYDYVPEELVAVARSARQKRVSASGLLAAGRRLGKFELLEQLGIG